MSSAADPPATPIACTLPATDLARRRTEVAALAAGALLDRRPSASGVALTFGATRRSRADCAT